MSATRRKRSPPPLPGQAPKAHRYLKVEDLRALRHLGFAPRRIVLGQYAGKHDSPQRGHSVEFSDYREYVPGDEIGGIDWKVYGRSDRLYLKLFEHQTDMTAYLVVDASASMAYRGLSGGPPPAPTRGGGFRARHANRQGVSKYDQACMLAAAIAFLVTKQQDKVSFTVAREGLLDYFPAHGTFPHLRQILDRMDNVLPKRTADLADTLDQLARRVKRRGMIIVFSDLMEDEEPILQQFARFLHRGYELIIFHTLHQDELELPHLGEALLTDSESLERMRVNEREVRGAYQEKLEAYLRRWRTACSHRGIDYNLVSTAQPYQEILKSYLFGRSMRR